MAHMDVTAVVRGPFAIHAAVLPSVDGAQTEYYLNFGTTFSVSSRIELMTRS
jgi:hypothetical protein